MNKRDFNVAGNQEADNQELAKGIAFIKSRRAKINVNQIAENMQEQAMPNGVMIERLYCDRTVTRDYDREALNAFFDTLAEENIEVVVIRSLNEITDDMCLKKCLLEDTRHGGMIWYITIYRSCRETRLILKIFQI